MNRIYVYIFLNQFSGILYFLEIVFDPVDTALFQLMDAPDGYFISIIRIRLQACIRLFCEA